jgi:hypothetical protein
MDIITKYLLNNPYFLYIFNLLSNHHSSLHFLNWTYVNRPFTQNHLINVPYSLADSSWITLYGCFLYLSETESLDTVPAPDDIWENGAFEGMRTAKENQSTLRKPALVPFCPPQIPHQQSPSTHSTQRKDNISNITHLHFLFNNIQIQRTMNITKSWKCLHLRFNFGVNSGKRSGNNFWRRGLSSL